MKVNVKKIEGIWDKGFSLDKHTISSTPIGYNDYGHMQFDTIRPEAGEALFQLKYRSDFTQAPIIASQMYESLAKKYPFVSFIVPMPASRQRQRQPVTEIARSLANLMNVPCLEEFLIKKQATPAMKDIHDRDEKVQTLENAFSINDTIGDGLYDVLVVDDLFDTGSSLEAATNVLKSCGKIQHVYVATVTRKK
ncbi:ComF family protein [Desulfobacter postgatei]|uniref:Putative amidophosphoribosyltransferase n=1 Tax=Desulfobacter postgatei 2ac9 TaxID=879212 RepID=I5AZZ7_9BACT|nr:ComF family protein [Desulfobacter postgatei]EIM62810.1 putative amidophosphoribosyltransferase [Desulfobacter postgatei 2ac9]